MQKIQKGFVPRVKGVQPRPKILTMLQQIWPVAENAYLGNLTGKEAIERSATLSTNWPPDCFADTNAAQGTGLRRLSHRFRL